MRLAVKIGKVTFANPVTVASGTFGYVSKYHDLKMIKILGAITPKTITLNAQDGNPPPRIAETPAGMVNAIGIQNLGIKDFIQNKLPVYEKFQIPIIASVSGKTVEEFQELVKYLNKTSVSAIELNLSCPNLKKKILVAQDADATREVVKASKKASRKPIIAKLTPNVTDISLIAQTAEEAGADAISMVNTFTAMVIDVKTCTSKIGNFTGGLSGPAIRPIALHMVYKTAQAVKIPIIAMGGIATAEDALQFFMAGATMVAVGTSNFSNPNATHEVLKGIKGYMTDRKIKDINHIIGSLKKEENEEKK